jgi:membrane-associated phospholipid phosphatase
VGRRRRRPFGVGADDRVGVVDLVLYKIIKRWIARPRPYCTCPEIRACARSLDEFSFPSGHTLHSVAFSVILTAYYPTFALFVWPFTVLVAVLASSSACTTRATSSSAR